MEIVRCVWPESLEDVTDDDLDRIYGYPDGLDRPFVQANFTSSADGAAAVDGRSEGLSSPGDKRIFFHGRLLADVVLAGAGTVRAENYRGARMSPERRAARARLGRSEVPPIAVVSGSARLDPSAPLFTDTAVPPIVVTTAAAPAGRRAALADAGADILVAGEETLDLRRALDGLAERGLLRIDCEGGPRLFGELVAEDLVDQLCVTVAPLLAGGDAGRIAVGRPAQRARAMDLASILVDDGFTMLRYRRRL